MMPVTYEARVEWMEVANFRTTVTVSLLEGAMKGAWISVEGPVSLRLGERVRVRPTGNLVLDPWVLCTIEAAVG